MLRHTFTVFHHCLFSAPCDIIWSNEGLVMPKIAVWGLMTPKKCWWRKIHNTSLSSFIGQYIIPYLSVLYLLLIFIDFSYWNLCSKRINVMDYSEIDKSHLYFNPIYLRRSPICSQDIFYSISLVFQSPVSFPDEYSIQIIHRLQIKQKCKILASQTFLITIL